MKKTITNYFFFAALFFLSTFSFAAELDQPIVPAKNLEVIPVLADSAVTKTEKNFKNTIRYNFTNTLLFSSKTLVFGYERTLGKNQSISIDLGPLSLPRLVVFDTDSIKGLSSGTTENGFHGSLDYRFYLKNENRYVAPRGVYLAPFISYNYFERTNKWYLDTQQFQGELSTNFKLEMFGFGGELGYQFILWKRLAIDLVLIGPGLTTYNIGAKVSTTLSTEDQTELFKLIHDAISDKIPGYDLVVDDLEFERTGSTKTTTFGFRYMINIGFRF